MQIRTQLPVRARMPLAFALGLLLGGLLMWVLLWLVLLIPTVVGAMIPAPSTGSVTESIVVPTRLVLPAAQIDATFTTPLGLNVDNTIMVPDVFNQVGWYKHSPLPGEHGPAILLGHINSKEGAAVFYHLRDVQTEDIIEVTLSNGSTTTFIIDKVSYFSQDTFPTEEVYGDIDYRGLRLISCSGTFNPFTKRYSHNLVVFARAIE